MSDYFENFNFIKRRILQQIALALGMRHSLVSSQQIHYAYRLLGTAIDFDNILRLVLCISRVESFKR